MTVDSELIFALAEQSRGHTARALERLVGSMATAWLDEGRQELLLARGMGRPPLDRHLDSGALLRVDAPRWI
jgi:Glutamine amidotransferase domain